MNTEIKGMNIYVKLAIAVVVLGGTVFGIYKLSKLVKGALENKDEKEEVKDVKDDLKDLEKEGKGKTLSDSQISGFANSLKIAMDGYQTDEEAIGKVFASMNNDADVLSLIKSYGIQTISSGRFSTEPDLVGTLPQALTSELSSDYKNTYVNANLIRKGIVYRF